MYGHVKPQQRTNPQDFTPADVLENCLLRLLTVTLQLSTAVKGPIDSVNLIQQSIDWDCGCI